MAAKSVATNQNTEVSGTEFELWLSCGTECLTVRLDRERGGTPPRSNLLQNLHETIVGLGVAVENLGSVLEGGHDFDEWKTGLALKGIADAIVLHAGLAEAINREVHRKDVPTLAAAA